MVALLGGGGVGVTVMLALPLTEGVAVLVAVTTPLVEVAEGVKMPLDIDPPVALHSTVWGADAGRTIAAQLDVALPGIVEGVQFTVTFVTGGGGVVCCRKLVPV